MNSTPIHPNDLLVEGAYVGDMMDFINKSLSSTSDKGIMCA